MNPRLVALQILVQVIGDGRSLNQCGASINVQIDDAKDRGLARELVFGTLRHYHQLFFILNHLMSKPLKARDCDISSLLLMGIYQLRFMRVPDHAAVNECVKLTQKIKKKWAKNLVNGLLRNYLREQVRLDELMVTHEESRCSHPDWLLKKLQQDWPMDWQSITEQNNCRAPMVLRVNRQQITVADYLKQLRDVDIVAESMTHAPDTVILEQARDVSLLPGFEQGLVSVQDAAAQQAASLIGVSMAPKEGAAVKYYVLDACSAPGGKTAHMLETLSNIEVLALDLSEKRAKLVENTLERLRLSATIKCADALSIDSWWDGRMFDRILLDAPCSATGVIRRNPDIKIHRTLDDISKLVNTQRELLAKLWPLLKPKGVLLYATCSILKDENENQMAEFLDTQKDAEELKINASWGRNCKVGTQVFPGDDQMDGFYYARIKKN